MNKKPSLKQGINGKAPCGRGMLLDIYSGCTVVWKHATVWTAVIKEEHFVKKETM